MRDIDAGLYQALLDAPKRGLVPRRFVRMTGKSFDTGAATEALFWTGDGVISMTVESPDDDSTITRTYYGGVSLDTSSIPLVSDLTIQTVSVSLAAGHPRVEDFVRGSDIRLGRVEIHDVMLDPATRNPVSVAPLIYLGQIDTAPVDLGDVDNDTTVTISSSSSVISMLSRTNPAKSSYEEQKLRNGDEWGLYSNTVSTWKIPWGTEK